MPVRVSRNRSQSPAERQQASPAKSAKGAVINLALQGGGSHGAFTWGVLDRLLEDGRLDFEAISGTSAGAMNLAVVAAGLVRGGPACARQNLDNFWRDVSGQSGLFGSLEPTPLNNMFWSWFPHAQLAMNWMTMVTGALSPYQFNPLGINPLRTILARHVDFEALHDSDLHLYVTATNVSTGKPRIFRTTEITLDAVMASAALPDVFQAVQIEDEHYWDGGYVGNPSLYPFFYESQSTDVLLVHINPLERKQLPVLRHEIDNRVNEITFNSVMMSEMRAIAFVQKLLSEGWIKDEFRDRLRDIRLHSLRADDWLSDLPLSSKKITDWGFLTMLRERGRQAAHQWLSERCEWVGARGSDDIKGRYLREKQRTAP